MFDAYDDGKYYYYYLANIRGLWWVIMQSRRNSGYRCRSTKFPARKDEVKAREYLHRFAERNGWKGIKAKVLHDANA